MLRYNYTESNELGKRLRRVRKAAGMTLQDLSNALNKEYGTHANKGTISKYENGIHEPNASTIFCISQIIGVSVDYLMGKTDMDYPSLLSIIEEKAKVFEQETAAAAVAAATGEAGDGDRAEAADAPANYSFDVEDNSMSPHYKIGDVLIIRTGLPVVDGQIYMVQYKRNKPMIRQLVMEKKKWTLKTENRSFDSTEIVASEDQEIPAGLKIIGRVIEFRRCEA